MGKSILNKFKHYITKCEKNYTAIGKTIKTCNWFEPSFTESELVALFCTSLILHFIMVKKNIIAKDSLFVRKQGLAILPRVSIKTICTEAHLTINHD